MQNEELNTAEKKLNDIKKDIRGTSEPNKKSSFSPIKISALMAIPFKDTEWLIQNLIPAESTVAISGAPASFKTWVVLDIAVKVSEGEQLFNKFTTKKVGVLIIDEENGERLLQARFKKLQNNLDSLIYSISLSMFKLSDLSIKDVLTFAKEKDIKLVIFDSLVRIHTSDENDAIKMAQVFSLFKKLNKEGITVIFTHHNRKSGPFKINLSQEMRGSSDILASVDCHLAVTRKPNEDKIIIDQTKLRQGQEIRAFEVNIIEDNGELNLEYSGEIDEVKNKKEICKEAIIGLLEVENRDVFKKELFDTLVKNGLGIGYSTFKTVIAELVKDGKLAEKKGERNKVFVSLILSSQEF